MRIRVVGMCWLVAIAAIWARVAYVQLALGPWHRATRASTEINLRPIPAPRGSIRTSDGAELARDRCDADLVVHYRYLERPIDQRWLVQQARQRLSRRERRNLERVNHAADELRVEIETMWSALAKLTGLSESELDDRARVVQRRVGRIVESVNRRHRERLESASTETVHKDPTRDNQAQRPILDRFLEWLADTPNTPDAEDWPIRVVEQNLYYSLVENISPSILIEYAANPEQFPGVRLEQRIRREYPAGELASGVIGYTAPNSGTSGSADAATAEVGVAGLEGFYDAELKGSTGHVRETMSRGTSLPRVLGGKAPTAGSAITITLDHALQQFAEESLRGAMLRASPSAPDGATPTSGSIIVLNARTGSILVAAVTPSFDPNVASRPSSDEAIALIERDDVPLYSRLVQMRLPPGSILKPITAIAAIKAGISPIESIACRGYLHEPDQFRCLIYRHFGVGHDRVDMHDALVRSCNVYFFQVAERIGGASIAEWAKRFGFGELTGIDLAGEERGTVPRLSRGTTRRSNGQNGESMSLAIGQGSVTVTPIQVAVMMSAIANGGYRIVPHFRRDAFQPPVPLAGIDGVTDSAIILVQQALRQAVANERGTAHDHVHLNQVAIAGKTGTAQSGSPRGDHAWFAGYAPADDPHFVMVVVLEHAGSGGHAAGPLARDLFRSMHQRGYFAGSLTNAHDNGPAVRPAKR